MSAGESPPSLHRRDTRDRAREEDSYEQTFADPPKTSLLPVSIAFSRRAFDEDRNTLPPSERLRRARAGKKRVSFVEPDDEVNDVLISVGQASNVISALEEPNHVRVSFTLPEPPLSSEGESFSDDAPCGTNEDLHTSIDFSLEEGSAPDPQTYASQRAIGSRKEREDVLA
ncbi:uncharacterized protein EKO05_0000664 [Ascochyta rabiei]|nr:uncharacterized protein EKO05_0000664 [Ascochyta rabiei]UPX09988.1 hypothetical protein EKO05_0000664 [Ascochyta rabiei]